jgi:hypothetical protein
LYENADEEVKEQFLSKKSIKDIVLYKSGICKYDQNGVLIQEFRSKHHYQQELKIGEKSLNKSLLSGEKLQENYYKFLPEKLYT